MKGTIGRPTQLKGGYLPKYRNGDFCPACNSSDNPKNGRLYLRNGKFGKFLGCSNYPNCKFTTTRIK